MEILLLFFIKLTGSFCGIVAGIYLGSKILLLIDKYVFKSAEVIELLKFEFTENKVVAICLCLFSACVIIVILLGI